MMRAFLLSGIAAAALLSASAADARPPSMRSWYGGYQWIEDDGPDVGGGRLISRHDLVIAPDRCVYDNPHPHGELKLNCEARPHGNRLDVLFKSCFEADAFDCQPKNFDGKPLFTLTQAGTRLLTRMGTLGTGPNARPTDKTLFKRGPVPEGLR